MRKLDYNEFKLCQILGRIFEKSIELSNLSSSMFIRRFMTYEGTKCFFDKSYLSLSNNDEDIIYELNNAYSETKNKTVYTKNQMYWIGYIYGALSYLYDLSSKTIYKLFPAKEIVKYYNIYHTFDIEEAAERMMENINYVKEDYNIRGILISKRLILLDDLKKLIGKEIITYIDDSLDLSYNGYDISYGHIKEYKTIKGNYQTAYVIRKDNSQNEFKGLVLGIINKNDSNEDILIISDNHKLTKEDILKILHLQKSKFKYKIICWN